MSKDLLPVSRREGLSEERLASEVILYDHANHRVHRLNQTMGFVWKASDGTNSIEDIAKMMTEETGNTCDKDLILVALSQLERENLLQAGLAEQPPLPSRRELGKKFANAGLSLAFLPALASMLAPTPAMARSADAALSQYQSSFHSAQSHISSDLRGYLSNQTAQRDFAQGVVQGGLGNVASLQGNTTLADRYFNAGASDFEGMLRALGF